MAELSTIARPYAEALFAAASGEKTAAPGALDQWLAVVAEMAAVAEHPEVAEVVGDPNLGATRVHDLVRGLIKTPLPGAAENFLKLVVENGRLAALPEVARQFRAMKNAAEGQADCVIESALPLTDAQVGDLLGSLSRKFGLKLIPQVKVDPELIGGVRVSVGDHVLDDTVKARLAQMQTLLTA